MRRELFFDHALLPSGWARDVRIGVADGIIASVAAGAARDGAEHIAGIAVPGLPNLHCHAFQRGMAGLAERRGPQADSFWTWREVMYRFLGAAHARRRRGDRRLRLHGDAGRRASPPSASSTICTTTSTAGPTPISARWRRASPPRQRRPASGSRCCRRSTPMAASAARRPRPASGASSTTRIGFSNSSSAAAPSWRACRQRGSASRRIRCAR